MSFPKFSLLVLAAAVLFSCSERKERELVAEESLEFNEVALLEDLGIPGDIEFVEDKLFITDFRNDSLVYVCSATDGKKLFKFAPKGIGPGEVLSPIMMMINGDSVYINSMPNNTIMSGSLDNPQQLSKKKDELAYEIAKIYSIGNNEYVASFNAFMGRDEMGKKRYCVLDSNFNPIYYFGEYPRFNSSEKDAPADVLSHYHQTRSILRMGENRLVATSGHDLTFYEKDEDGKYVTLKSECLFPYDYDVRPSTETVSAYTKLKDGYSRGISQMMKYGDKIILGILSEPKPSSSGSLYFEIRDSEGKLLKHMIPTMKVESPIAINDKGEIYGFIETEDGYTLVKSSVIE